MHESMHIGLYRTPTRFVSDGFLTETWRTALAEVAVAAAAAGFEGTIIDTANYIEP